MNSLNEYFTDAMIFDMITGFLTISDILKLSRLSKDLYNIIGQKCKQIIKFHQLSFIQSKSAIHQMKFYFDRCLTIQKKKATQISEQIILQKFDKQNSDKCQQSRTHTIQEPFKFKTIIYFEVGVIFTAFLTIQNEAFIFKTGQLMKQSKHNKKQLIKYQRLLNIKQVKVKSNHASCLLDSGCVKRYFGPKDGDLLIEKEQIQGWTNNIIIESIEASYNYTIFVPKNQALKFQQFCLYVLGYDIDMKKVNDLDKDQQSKSGLILFNNITFKYYFLEFQNTQKIIQMAVGSRQAYFINQKFQIFVCYFQSQDIDHPVQNNGKKIKIKRFKPFQTKKIIKISSGYNFYIALQRQINDVQNWCIQQVCKWVRQIGFQQFAKIFAVQKVDGKKLLQIDKVYMQRNLGITKPNMQQKFIMLLQQTFTNNNKCDTLYGWGKNQTGQLGSRNSNFIKQPQKIKINCLKQNQYIDSIFCGWFDSFIRTQKGRVYRTLNCEKRKKNNRQQQIHQQLHQQDFAKHQNKKGIQLNLNDWQEEYTSKSQIKQKIPNKKRRKYTHDLVKRETGHKKFEQQQKWVQCSVGKAFFVQTYKQVIFYIQCQSQKQFQPVKQKKLRTAKMILNRIIWSFGPQLQILYKIGYMDKDMGLIQITIDQLKKFDYNQNRIRNVKKQGIIVWDRENKIDQFT